MINIDPEKDIYLACESSLSLSLCSRNSTINRNKFMRIRFDLSIYDNVCTYKKIIYMGFKFNFINL